MMTIMVCFAYVVLILLIEVYGNIITGIKDTYSLSESEVNSFFDDDGSGMDVTLSGIHGK